MVASLLLAAIVYLLFYKSQGVPDNLFVVSYFLHIIVLGLGILVFFLRLLRLAPLPVSLEKFLDGLNNPQRFFYIFMGTANVLFGVGAIILYLFAGANSSIISEFWPHLVLAAVLLSDSFILSKEKIQSYV